MMKFVIAVCLLAYVMAQNTHPGHGDQGHHNHHPHPDGHIACKHNDDCSGCNATYTNLCVEDVCRCGSLAGTLGKRADGCHNGHACDSQCPVGQNGVCKNNKCDCGDHAKRANTPCTDVADCTAASFTCDDANHVVECKHHKRADHPGHCHCKHQ